MRPKLIECLKGYNRQTLLADTLAGVSVGIVALPLAMAFAIASGVKPEAGIFTAIVAGFIISALGGSKVQIGGPTGAFIVIIYNIVAEYGFDNLVICTLMAGVLLLIMGVLRLGVLIKFIPLPVIIGFTNGIALLILISQIKDFLGLTTGPLPAEFFSQITLLWHSLPSAQPVTIAMSVSCFTLLCLWPQRFNLRVPGPVVVLFLSTLVSAFFELPLDTIGSRFGGIPQSLPQLHWPHLQLSQLSTLIIPAFTIALLGAIESLLCAVVADSMIKDKHDANQELFAQGTANIITAFFGGIPATGAIARTSINVRNGAKTPIAGIIHALTLLIIILIAAPLAKHIPLACLAAILISVALKMGQWEAFKEIRQYSHSRTTTLLSTFFLTLVLNLSMAVGIGMAWAVVVVMRRLVELTHVLEIKLETFPLNPHAVVLYEVQGALFFGAADKLEIISQHHQHPPQVVILDFARVLYLDSTAGNTLVGLARLLKDQNTRLVICGIPKQSQSLMKRSGLSEILGPLNILDNREAALALAQEITTKA